MWLKINQLKVTLDFDETQFMDYLNDFLHLQAPGISKLQILHKSLDARHKELAFVYHIMIEVDLSVAEITALLQKHTNVTVYQPLNPRPIALYKLKRPLRPVIVGAGPAGLFAGLKLAAAGLRPIIIDRGEALAERITKVNRFWQEGILDPDSNIQFGIGGAGTFSDGKLMTRLKDPILPEILRIIVEMGGPAEILYWQYPHIGTDVLRNVVTKIQQLIIEYGGEFRFQHCLTDIEVKQGAIKTLKINRDKTLETDLLILAVGNSGRDVYELLIRRGFQVIAKPFAVGLRIEHPQDLIDKAQYGRWAGHSKLGPAEYHLTFQHQETGRGVYSFCMCPGGSVIGATSEYNSVVTNGMSYHARDSGRANSAIIATVHPKDFMDSGPLAGVAFQRKLEQKAFSLGGANYCAPVQKVADFLNAEPSVSFTEFSPSYRPGFKSANLWDLLPPEICQAIQAGLSYFGQQIKDFDWPEAVLTGIETRTSSPVRIVRDEQRQAIGFSGVYPVGEGAGYAGGIISSALDGWKTAEEIIEMCRQDPNPIA
jgi:uncharacterized FAD-dependent dehydrogenase